MGEGEGEHEDEDEEDEVVLGDGSCAAMRAGAALGCGGLRCRHCGEDRGHFPRLWVRGGWLRGPGLDLAARGADPCGSGLWRRCGTAVPVYWAGVG